MIEQLAYHLGRNDEEPNIRLAIALCSANDANGIKEIVEGLKSKKKEVANDCIKVLYEIGERVPELVAEYVDDFIQLLNSKNNRLVWGGMTALSQITFLKHREVYENFDIVYHAYKTGSVITVDQAISVFAALCKAGRIYESKVFGHILHHLTACKPKEIGQHAERAFICINENNSKAFAEVLIKRKEHLSDAQRKRIEKLLRKIESGKYVAAGCARGEYK